MEATFAGTPALMVLKIFRCFAICFRTPWLHMRCSAERDIDRDVCKLGFDDVRRAYHHAPRKADVKKWAQAAVADL